mmetsp:Transcript_26610/g.73212  ORF Transcript_26610/g.73212 Transcript_26610/m.73212 type:complete len:274 (+) Transcript_26610:348-1169(+)
MPFLSRACGARIFYETKGPSHGIPVLLLAPGGMRSSLHKWDMSPYNPWIRLASRSKSNNDDDNVAKQFRLIAVDQRFAGRSSAAVQRGDGWHAFLEDQLALLNHLGVHRCHLVGSCIGPSYALQLLTRAPERFGRCVMLQPIGLAEHTTEPGPKWEGLNASAAWDWVGSWADERIESTSRWCSEDRAVLTELYGAMFAPPRDFVFSVTRREAAAVEHPLLVFMGNDIYHPSDTARQIARIVKRAELVEVWRDAGPEKINAAAAKISSFLMPIH